jgi:uncharacterized membrane protein YjjP (DUF1212 family)
MSCTQFTQTSGGVTTCTAQGWVDTYVVTPDEQAQLQLVIQGGFDSSSFSLFFGGTLLMFATGFAVGIVISQLRKLRRG